MRMSSSASLSRNIVDLRCTPSSPIILVRKAEKLRQTTGDNQYYAPLEKEEKLPFLVRLNHIVARPFKILFQEPMLMSVTLYMSVSVEHRC
jgi:hypothetical protein